MVMPVLSGELIEEILCRVPATFLKRLRSTSKRWDRLFNDSIFARNHLDKAPKQFLALALIRNRVCSISLNLLGSPSIKEIRELSLNDSHLNSIHNSYIYQVSYCDGLLLCINGVHTGIVVWNPCTGQTKWITPSTSREKGDTYHLGSYQDNKSHSNSYKILRISRYDDLASFEICEIKSNSWRILDITLKCKLLVDMTVFLKGKSYWFGLDEEEKQLLLVSFSYTGERFELMDLPFEFPIDVHSRMALCAVGEEKLCLLLERSQPLRKEIWVSNKIDHHDQTKAVSWIKLLALDYPERYFRLSVIGFLVDEEKKLLVCCDLRRSSTAMLHIIKEDDKVTEVDFKDVGYGWPRLFNYAPSLIQI